MVLCYDHFVPASEILTEQDTRFSAHPKIGIDSCSIFVDVFPQREFYDCITRPNRPKYFCKSPAQCDAFMAVQAAGMSQLAGDAALKQVSLRTARILEQLKQAGRRRKTAPGLYRLEGVVSLPAYAECCGKPPDAALLLKQTDGSLMLDAAQLRAGEHLRRDYERAHFSGRVTANMTLMGPAAGGWAPSAIIILKRFLKSLLMRVTTCMQRWTPLDLSCPASCCMCAAWRRGWSRRRCGSICRAVQARPFCKCHSHDWPGITATNRPCAMQDLDILATGRFLISGRRLQRQAGISLDALDHGGQAV